MKKFVARPQPYSSVSLHGGVTIRVTWQAGDHIADANGQCPKAADAALAVAFFTRRISSLYHPRPIPRARFLRADRLPRRVSSTTFKTLIELHGSSGNVATLFAWSENGDSLFQSIGRSAASLEDIRLHPRLLPCPCVRCTPEAKALLLQAIKMPRARSPSFSRSLPLAQVNWVDAAVTLRSFDSFFAVCWLHAVVSFSPRAAIARLPRGAAVTSCATGGCRGCRSSRRVSLSRPPVSRMPGA